MHFSLFVRGDVTGWGRHRTHPARCCPTADGRSSAANQPFPAPRPPNTAASTKSPEVEHRQVPADDAAGQQVPCAQQQQGDADAPYSSGHVSHQDVEGARLKASTQRPQEVRVDPPHHVCVDAAERVPGRGRMASGDPSFTGPASAARRAQGGSATSWTAPPRGATQREKSPGHEREANTIPPSPGSSSSSPGRRRSA